MLFKLMHGTHTDGNPERHYKAGELIETDQDLRLLNGQGMSPKFLFVDGDTDLQHSPALPHPPSDPPTGAPEVDTITEEPAPYEEE